MRGQLQIDVLDVNGLVRSVVQRRARQREGAPPVRLIEGHEGGALRSYDSINPPLTESTAPLTKSLAGSKKNRTAAAMSSAVPGRPRGLAASMPSASSRVSVFLRMSPGSITLTVIPRLASSSAS